MPASEGFDGAGAAATRTTLGGGTRDSSRASRSGGTEKITVSLIGDGLSGCCSVTGSGSGAGRARRIEPVGVGSGTAVSVVARDSKVDLPAQDVVELLLELLLVEQLAARGAVDLGAQVPRCGLHRRIAVRPGARSAA